MIDVFKWIKNISKWTILKVVWNLALMGLLILNLLIVNGIAKFNVLSTWMIVDNQRIMDMKATEHDHNSCKKIDI